ncbi:cAMP-dependent protein kinase inhibitor beta isoform X2 [Dendroctonus ponderosae]|uniref:cAMP-dependent protein kinase inhibitor beta n=1 Tax=Dendroctonus ponderosae TaxID=77166 RepID=A0AAR5P2P1_DENPD|nr:cAMP-dependent protein kinase inhibitor beta isoform X2 [Dendroctonus ponderosae]
MSMVGGTGPAGRITRCPRKGLTTKAVLKMLAVMEAGAQSAGPSSASGSSAPNEPPIKEFLSSGRTGRRNALPDILGQHAVVTSSDLPSRLQALSTKDSNSSGASHLGEPQPGPSSAKS